ncbi:MAG: hypothetical protein U1E65_32145 [Myxococcota bacterium]
MNAPKATLTPKLQQLGKRMVLQLHMVLRTIRVHDPTNNALLVATENLKDTINTLWAGLGGIRLQFVEDVVYLNDVRLRIDHGSAEQISWLRHEFGARGLGGLAFARPVDGAALKDFLVILARPVESDDDAKVLRESLTQMKDLALELLGPRSFGEEGTVEEIRIDKKTFALQTYAKSVVAARECVAAMRSGADPLGTRLPVTRIIQDLIDIATERVNLLLKMCAIKQADEYVYNHAANTSVLSIVIGKALGIERLRLVDLGVAAFLADLGFALLPPELVDRPTKISDAERQELVGAMVRTIRTLIGQGRITDSVVRRVLVAYEHHHPYLDPVTQKPTPIHVYSRIVAVADAYDALTTHRPWRAGFSPDEALRMLSQEAGTRFDPLVVRVLVNLMGLYPLGTTVLLDTGELGIIYHNSNDPRLFEKPWVKILKDARGTVVKKTLIRNLAEHEGPGGTITGRPTQDMLAGIDLASAVVL